MSLEIIVQKTKASANKNKNFLIAASVVVAASIFDAYMTVSSVKQFGVNNEKAIALKYLMQHFGTDAAYASKAFVIPLYVALAYELRSSSNKWLKLLTNGNAMLYAAALLETWGGSSWYLHSVGAA